MNTRTTMLALAAGMLAACAMDEGPARDEVGPSTGEVTATCEGVECSVPDEAEPLGGGAAPRALTATTTVAAATAAGPAKITALESTATGLRLRFTTTDPAITSIAINRMDKEAGYYRRLGGVPVAASQQYTYLDGTAALGHEYCFVVVTRVADQTSGTLSEARCAVFTGDLGPVPPAAPTNPRITSRRERSLRVAFVDASTDETRFTVEQRDGTAWKPVASVGAKAGTGTDVTVSVGDLDVEEHYCFRVRATGPGGSGVTLPTCGDTTPIFAQDPMVTNDTPWIARVVHPAPGELQVQWLDVAGERDWDVVMRRSVDYSAPLGTAHVTDSRPVPSTEHALTFKNLTPGAMYCFVVKRSGKNSGVLCDSPKAARTSSDQRDPTPAATPRVGGLTPRNKSVAIVIDNAQPGQVIERTAGATGHRETVFIDAGTRADFTDTTVSPGTLYCYRLIAFNGFGARYSDYGCTTTTADLPGTPGDLTTELNGLSLTMRWSRARNADSYDVHFVGKKPQYTDHDGDKSTTGTSMTIELREGRTYCVEVRARNDFGTSSWVEKCGIEVGDDGLTTYTTSLVNDTPSSGNIVYFTNVAPGGSANLVRVRVAGTEGITPYAVRFLGPGLSAADCGTNAGVLVQPGGTLEGADLATLYGASEPALPLTLIGCKIIPSNTVGTLDPMPVSITYRR